MRHFIIFFEEKEGTSPLMRLLNNFDQISIVHQVNNSGWEPFDRHTCGPMSLRSLEQCLELIFNKEPLDIERLNHIYIKTAKQPLESINKSGSVGFKMRFKPATKIHRAIRKLAPSNGCAASSLGRIMNGLFNRVMINLLKRNNVVVFLAIRQDTLRWALSKYHGNGRNRAGHLQFELARGEIRKDQIGKLHVDCKRLEKIISRCEQSHAGKRDLMKEFQRTEIEVYPLCYEDFTGDKIKYFQRICEILNIEVSIEEINSALTRGGYFEKVHSDQISDFVENHQEVMERFGNRFVSWQ